MDLTFEQIISATNGIVRTEQNDIGLELHRFTREQEAFFHKTHPLYCNDYFFNGYFSKNCRTCAGISIDFISDLTKLRIKFGKIEYTHGSRGTIFDLYVDGEFVQSFEAFEEIIYKVHEGQHRFTLYFPYLAFPIISSIELENATVFLPQKKQPEILFLGDSITHGARALHPSDSYVMRIARSMDIGILNQGNSGFVYDADSVEKVCDPKIVVTAYGINDFMRKNIQMLESDTSEFIKKVKSLYSNSKIVSILPLWTVWDGEDENFKKDERDCLKRVYEEYSDYIIDGRNLIPHDEKYLCDGVHPNSEGFKFYAENLTKELTSIIEKR